MALLNANHLCQQSVHQVAVVLRFVGLFVWCQPQLDELLVGYIIEAKEVCSSFLDGASISAQSIGIHSRQQLTASVPKTLMQVCVEVIANISILVQKRPRLIVNHELFTHPRTFCSLIVSTSQVGNRDTLAAVFSPNPIAIRQVYSDSTTGIEVASKHGSTDDLRTHTLARLLLEALINWRVLFEPPSIVAQSFGSQCCFVVDDVHIALPACFESKRVAIDFGEAIGEIHFALRLVHPKDGIFVEGLQVSCPIELHQLVYDSLLLVVLGISTSLA